MRLGEIKCPKGSRRNRKRLGQGPGSGTGKTAGKGHKGNARVQVRDGVIVSALLRVRLLIFGICPRSAFSNHNFRVVYQTVNIADIESRGLEGEVGVDELLAAGLVRSDKQPIKILGDGELSRSVTIKAQHFSKKVRARKSLKKLAVAAEVIEEPMLQSFQKLL